MQVEADVVDPSPPTETTHAHPDLTDGVPPGPDKIVFWTSDDELDQVVPGGDLAGGERADQVAVAHHRYPVGELGHLVQSVRDIDDALALVAHGAHDAEHLLHLVGTQ